MMAMPGTVQSVSFPTHRRNTIRLDRPLPLRLLPESDRITAAGQEPAGEKKLDHYLISSSSPSWRAEVVRPDVILMLGPQPHARAVIEPQASTRFLLLWNLQPFAAPDPFHSILAHIPTGLMQLDRDAPITIPTKVAGQRDDGPG